MIEPLDDPHKKVQERVDKKIGETLGYPSVELETVYENLQYTKQAKENPIPKGTYSKNIFGVELVDMSFVEKDNIWNRGIFTVDKHCRMFLSWRIEQLQKYLKKKRKISSKMAWLIILLAGGGFIIVLILLLLLGVI